MTVHWREDAAPLVLATRSAGKIRELRALCEEAGIATSDLAREGVAVEAGEDEAECFETFEENARAKAAWYSARLPGRLLLAEDSGLEVRALGGAPGVRSKRWAGLDATLSGAALDAANNEALVRALRAAGALGALGALHAPHEGADRRARYTCAAVLMRDGRVIAESRGECAGRIVEVPRGDAGFGYDPWFESEELGRTFGEASAREKSRVSHRARAVRTLLGGT